MRLIWVEGRLAWPLVITIAYLTLSLIGVDYAWRVFVIPFETLIICMLLIDALVAVLLIALYAVFGRTRLAQLFRR